MRFERVFAIGVLWVAVAALQAQDLEKWEIGPFTRPERGYDVIRVVYV